MVYTVKQRAPGSYDVLRDGIVIVALVRVIWEDESSNTWQIELLDEMPAIQRLAPFMSQWHTFKSYTAALEWLGINVNSEGQSCAS